MYVHGFWEPGLGLVVVYNPGGGCPEHLQRHLWEHHEVGPLTQITHIVVFVLGWVQGRMDLVWSWPKSGKARFGCS